MSEAFKWLKNIETRVWRMINLTNPHEPEENLDLRKNMKFKRYTSSKILYFSIKKRTNAVVLWFWGMYYICKTGEGLTTRHDGQGMDVIRETWMFLILRL